MLTAQLLFSIDSNEFWIRMVDITYVKRLIRGLFFQGNDFPKKTHILRVHK